MEVRKPFQGLLNIIRFNWHYYFLALLLIIGLFLLSNVFNNNLGFGLRFISLFIGALILISLIVSSYIYDFSNLYKLSWLNDLIQAENKRVININAGFDETSSLLRDKYPASELIVYNFYDPLKHTEISIKRAMKVYPSFPNTKKIEIDNFPIDDHSADVIFVIFAAHEIRSSEERERFFKEIKRVIHPFGKIVITEHLRNAINFTAYNIGFFHFQSKRTWLTAFKSAQLEIEKEIKITPFITTFILKKNGTSA